MKKTKIIITIIALIIVLALIGLIGYGYYKKATMKVQNPVAKMEVKDFGTIKLELYPDLAPETVANFIKLSNNGYYDGLTFHRIIKDFMIQGGDQKGDGTGKVTLSALDKNIEKDSDADKEYNIKGEFIANGVKNTLKHEEGVISMARAYDPNSAGSQFFIMHKDGNFLDGQYAAFGETVEGIEVVDKVAAVRTSPNDKPLTPVVINTITIED